MVKNSNVIIGDYTYYDDFTTVTNFEKNIRYFFDFIGDKLIIGKFCAIASGVEFIMNGGNHFVNAISTYPFEIFGCGWEKSMEDKSYPHKGDIVIGNDVWIGYKSLIMPGINIGDGAIIGACSVVTHNIPPYCIAAGNPATVIRKRFSDESINKLLTIKWWDWRPEEITRFVHLLTSNNIEELERVWIKYVLANSP